MKYLGIIGRGQLVHVITEYAHLHIDQHGNPIIKIRAICGTGDIGVGHRRSSKVRKTYGAVTCQKCLKVMEECPSLQDELLTYQIGNLLTALAVQARKQWFADNYSLEIPTYKP